MSQAGGASPPDRGKRRLLRAFGRSQDGASAVEFAIVALPFFALLFAIVETALMFWANEVLEESLSEASRRLLTGQAVSRYASSDPAANAKAFRNDICAAAPMSLIDCTKLYVDVKIYTTFADASGGTKSPISGGNLDVSTFSYNQPQPGQIVVARAVLDYPFLMTGFLPDQTTPSLANLKSGHRALVATTAFRAEPFCANC